MSQKELPHQNGGEELRYVSSNKKREGITVQDNGFQFVDSLLKSRPVNAFFIFLSLR
jgi:hypothetical protein